ncbi:MAG TPA: tRNA lysidine(34) synthetase TilS [Nitrospirota bacterium]|nr:tRNA lysidine(34) synthetase TilS [Nitrospirota bacterium]
MLLLNVQDTIRKYGLLDPGDRVVVAVSGGPDSVCLLAILHTMAKNLGLSLHVAHLDHMFRGEESAEEAQFVADLSKKLGIPSTSERFDVPAFCRERGLSAQEGARKVRYGFLEQVAHDTGASRIATGHTADDQAETFLLRLLRGAGVSGLSSIPPRRGMIIRPLIEITRDQVLDYLRENSLGFRTDPSNAKPVYTRNRVRMDVIPVLRQFNPRIVETLAAEAALLRDEDEAVDAYLGSVTEAAHREDDETVSIKRDAFDTLPPAFRRRLLRKIADMTDRGASFLSLGQIDDALSFMLSTQTGKSIMLSPGLSVTREYDRFVFSSPAARPGFSRTLSHPGATMVPELGLEVKTLIAEGRRTEPELSNYIWQAQFDYDKIGPLLTLRSRHSGDRFSPSGMAGRSKKLQDYFVDAKVPRRKRDRVPLLCSGEDILWVVGLRTDERFLVTEATRTVLTVLIRPSGARHGE